MDNNEIFLKFWQDHQWQDPDPLFFRLYHDEQGNPLQYSRQDLPGLYIDVSPEQFAIGDMRVKIKDGQIIAPEPPRPVKLVQSESGVACDARDVTVIVSIDQNHKTWSMRRNDQD